MLGSVAETKEFLIFCVGCVRISRISFFYLWNYLKISEISDVFMNIYDLHTLFDGWVRIEIMWLYIILRNVVLMKVRDFG